MRLFNFNFLLFGFMVSSVVASYGAPEELDRFYETVRRNGPTLIDLPAHPMDSLEGTAQRKTPDQLREEIEAHQDLYPLSEPWQYAVWSFTRGLMSSLRIDGVEAWVSRVGYKNDPALCPSDLAAYTLLVKFIRAETKEPNNMTECFFEKLSNGQKDFSITEDALKVIETCEPAAKVMKFLLDETNQDRSDALARIETFRKMNPNIAF